MLSRVGVATAVAVASVKGKKSRLDGILGNRALAGNDTFRLMLAEGFTDYNTWKQECTKETPYNHWPCVPDGCPECPATRGSTNGDIFIDFGVQAGDSIKSTCDDCDQVYQLSVPWKFFGRYFTEAHISDNGFISFGDANISPPDRQTGFGDLTYTGSPGFSAYWIDVDLTMGGQVFYRHDEGNSQVDQLIRTVEQDPSYQSTWNFIVTFEKAAIFESHCVDRSVTHQALLSTDGFEYYAVFNYGDIELNGGYNNQEGDPCQGKFEEELFYYGAVAGFNDGRGNVARIRGTNTKHMIDVELFTNVGIAGQYVFRVGEEIPYVTPDDDDFPDFEPKTTTTPVAATTLVDTTEEKCFTGGEGLLEWYLEKLSLESFLEIIYGTGSYGPLLNPDADLTSVATGGRPLCDFDQLLAWFVRAIRCLAMDPSRCDKTLTPFCVIYDPITESFTCKDSPQYSCEQFRCESDLDSLQSIANFLKANPDFTGCSAPRESQNSVGGGGQSKDTCCMSTLVPYHSSQPSRCTFTGPGTYFFEF